MIIELTSFQYMVAGCILFAIIFLIVCVVGRLMGMPWLVIGGFGIIFLEILYLGVIAPELGLHTAPPDLSNLFVVVKAGAP